jgi:hypothetical protein
MRKTKQVPKMSVTNTMLGKIPTVPGPKYRRTVKAKETPQPAPKRHLFGMWDENIAHSFIS